LASPFGFSAVWLAFPTPTSFDVMQFRPLPLTQKVESAQSSPKDSFRFLQFTPRLSRSQIRFAIPSFRVSGLRGRENRSLLP
jgi:hypothetical protein